MFNSSFFESKAEMEFHLKNRISFFYIFSIIGILSAFIFSIVNFFIGNLSMSMAELVASAIAFFNLYYFKKKANFKLASSIMMFIMIILLVVIIIKGGVSNTGIYWMYTFPLLAFFLRGKRDGIFWIAFLIISILSLLLLEKLNFVTLAYEFIELRQAILSLLAISIMAYFYEKISFDYSLQIQKRNEELNELNENLKLRVKEEVSESRKKDKLLIEQSKLASMGEMIGNIAHQWRQPLNALGLILQNIQFSYKRGKLDEKQIERVVTKGNKIINKMSNTIDDFRYFFKPNKQKEYFDVIDSIEHAMLLIDATFEHYGISVKIEKNNLNILGFKNEFSQVILNILNNSKDAFLEKNIEDKKILIVIVKEEKKATIAISDNAGGIREDILNRIFEPYFTTKEQGKGTGIGLYMSKMIIEESMEGKISVQNIDNGVLFKIELPL